MLRAKSVTGSGPLMIGPAPRAGARGTGWGWRFEWNDSSLDRPKADSREITFSGSGGSRSVRRRLVDRHVGGSTAAGL